MNRARRAVIRKCSLSLLWLNFVFLWYRVHAFTTVPDAVRSVGYLSVMIVVYGAIAAAWIYHNVRIWRKKGPRLSVRTVFVNDTQDSMLHDVQWTIDVEQVQNIRVSMVGNSKIFLEGGPRRPRRQRLA